MATKTKIRDIYCSSIEKAEQEINKLYEQYDTVKVISAPIASEAGVYRVEIGLNQWV